MLLADRRVEEKNHFSVGQRPEDSLISNIRGWGCEQNGSSYHLGLALHLYFASAPELQNQVNIKFLL